MAQRPALPPSSADGVALEAKLFRGFADASRLGILTALSSGRKKVGELVEITGLSQPNVSNHLSCLKECGLVRAEPKGRFVYYELADPRVGRLIQLGREILADVAEGIYHCTRYEKGTRRDG